MNSSYSLDITYEVNPITEFTQFLDIKYKFEGGKLSTELFRKPTDASNRHLKFSSFHPRHTFRSIVYSQALRYRRIINDDELLVLRLNELRGYFEQSSYPPDMVKEVMDDVRARPRVLRYIDKDKNHKTFTTWVMEYSSGYEETKSKVKEVNGFISNCRTWKGTKSSRHSL